MPEGSEALDTPEPNEAQALEAASKARIAELIGGAPGGNTQEVEDADGTQASGQVEPAETSPSGGSAPSQGPDLEWAPAELRKDFGSLNPAALEWLQKERSGLHKGFTQKSQELAALKKQAPQWEQDAANWQAVVSNPVLLKSLTDAMERAEHGGEASAAPRWSEMTDDEINAEISRRAEAVAARVLDEKVLAPQRTVSATVQAVEAYQTELGDGVTATAFEAACRTAVERLGKGAFTPENARFLLEPYVEAAVLREQVAQATQRTEQSKAEAARAARASSSPGTGGIAPQRQKTEWESKGRIPSSAELLRDRTLKRLQEMAPDREWSLARLEDLARSTGVG